MGRFTYAARMSYEESLNATRDWENMVEAKLVEGCKEGLELGIAKGRKEGKAEGMQEGIAMGKSEATLEIARNMKRGRKPVELIAEVTGLSPAQIESL